MKKEYLIMSREWRKGESALYLIPTEDTEHYIGAVIFENVDVNRKTKTITVETPPGLIDLYLD